MAYSGPPSRAKRRRRAPVRITTARSDGPRIFCFGASGALQCSLTRHYGPWREARHRICQARPRAAQPAMTTRAQSSAHLLSGVTVDRPAALPAPSPRWQRSSRRARPRSQRACAAATCRRSSSAAIPSTSTSAPIASARSRSSPRARPPRGTSDSRRPAASRAHHRQSPGRGHVDRRLRMVPERYEKWLARMRP
jgi:hypothetical protein